MFPPPPPEMPCIRCTACVDACPADLQPHELYWFARSKNFGKAQEYHLFDCIECGCCAYVCPSHIPLVDYYRFAKSEIWAREREKEAADAARERFEYRTLRLEREKQEKAEKLAAKTGAAREAAQKKQADCRRGQSRRHSRRTCCGRGFGGSAQEGADRRRHANAPGCRRPPSKPKNIRHLTPEQKAEIAEIEARRAKIRQMAKTPEESSD